MPAKASNSYFTKVKYSLALKNDKEHVNRIVLPSENRKIDVKKILDYLGDLEVQTLLLEGGLETWKRFLEEKLVDSAHLCISEIELKAKNENYFLK